MFIVARTKRSLLHCIAFNGTAEKSDFCQDSVGTTVNLSPTRSLEGMAKDVILAPPCRQNAYIYCPSFVAHVLGLVTKTENVSFSVT